MMHIIDIKKNVNNIDSTIIYLMGVIHEYKGKSSLYKLSDNVVRKLINSATINSVIYSNKIEGIVSTKEGINNIICNRVDKYNKSDKELAGYKAALELINDNYQFMEINSNTILQLHKILFKYTDYSFKGKYKDSDNYIQEIDKSRNKRIRFTPVKAHLVNEYIDNLCASYNDAINNHIDPLLIIPIFVLDFLCIHPFNDGNGRLSRLLTTLLLYKSGYNISKYMSIEEQIDSTKESYYDSLYTSSIDWHDNMNNYNMFIIYYLNTILSSYIEFDNIYEYNNMKIIDRVKHIIKDSIIPLNKNDIYNKILDTSMISIERSLNELLGKGIIIKIGKGRSTKYKYNINR